MDLENVLFPPYPGELLHPVVYACTSVLLLCMLTSIITYIVHHSAIRISHDGWHVFVNLCFQTALTFTAFAGGINRTESPVACQAVGIVLHFSTLSSLLWLALSARGIYTQVSKEMPQGPHGDQCTLQRPPPTVLRFYLVSGGVPLFICIITAATNIENYGSGDHRPLCWMAWEPSLGAFYGPVALVVLATCTYFVCASVQLWRHPERRYELQVVTEEQRRLAGGTGDHPGAMLANELSLRAQLRTAAFTLFLFLATWTSGALAVWLDPVLDMAFSCVYGGSCASLGLFLLIQHCAKRDDVWQRWWACRSAPPPAPALPKPSANGDALLNTTRPAKGGPCCVSPLGQRSAEGDTQPGGTSRLPLQSCLKDRAKPRPQGRYTCRMASSSVDGSIHSSYLDSPHSTIEAHVCHAHDAHVCHSVHDAHTCHRAHDVHLCHGVHDTHTCHGAHACPNVHDSHTCCSTNEGHMCREGFVCNDVHEGHVCSNVHKGFLCKDVHEGHVCSSTCEQYACNNLRDDCECHRLHLCPKVDPYGVACQGDNTCPAVYGCGTTATKETLLPQEAELQNLANQRQPPAYMQSPANQDGGLKESLTQDFLYNVEPTGSIRTGVWKNETSV